MKKEPILTESEMEILSWFCKPFFDSAIKHLSRDAVIVLLQHIAKQWNASHQLDRLVAKTTKDGKTELYMRLGPDALLIQAMNEEAEE